MSLYINVKNDVDIQRLPVNSEEQQFSDWKIRYTKSHILHSQCTTADQCLSNAKELCQFCMYTNTLQLAHLPEMVFPNNVLLLKHKSGLQIEFNALEALKLVSSQKLDLKVAYADSWKETRDPTHLEEKIKPFDWTFSTDYKGSITGPVQIDTTKDRIDIERLKQKEKILFFHELMLFEDELHDNGIASCIVKVRVMPSSYFVLLRYFLRVDGVMVRVNDTRLYHDFSTNYILREFTNRECAVKQLKLPLPMFADPNLLAPYMPLQSSCYEKLLLVDSESSTSNAESTSTESSSSQQEDAKSVQKSDVS